MTDENDHFAVTKPNLAIIIGKDCILAYNIDIRTGDSHSIIDWNTKQRLNHAQNVIIGNHVGIAAHCSILKGSHIILAGVPAKLVKTGISWLKERL